MYKAAKAQTLLTYALLILIVVAVFLAMRSFLSKSFQAKFRQAADTFGGGMQYESGVTKVQEN